METRQGRDRCKFGSLLLALCLATAINQGCGGPDGPNQTPISAAPPAQQNLPFHQNPDHATDDSAHPEVPADRSSSSSTPFRTGSHSNAHSLPAGTLITVRLDSSLPISRVRAGDTFSASLAGPVTMDGDTAIERGTPVSGCVESAQPAVDRPGLSPDPGFLRLTLKTVTVDGSTLALQTSSLFAKGTLQPMVGSVADGSSAGSRGFWVQKGRRLTFRLTAPVSFAGSNSIAKYGNSASE
ncbi:MAG: hypothetical protein ABR880_14310 [Candidatus Sulfotelmatobacter sp.]|jgi:hypothetical protein